MSLNTSNIIHIVVETITLVAITTYFMQQNKKMMEHIDNLNEKIEEQDEKLLKHDKLISDILKKQNKLSQAVANPVANPVVKQQESIPIPVQQQLPLPIPTFTQLFTPSTINTMLFSNSNPYDQKSDSNVEEIIDPDEDEEEDYEEDCCVNGVCTLPSYLRQEPEPEPVQELVEVEPEEQVVDQVQEIVEPEPQKVEEIQQSESSKKRKKKKKKSVSLTDIDKELEDELNELYKEEINS